MGTESAASIGGALELRFLAWDLTATERRGPESMTPINEARRTLREGTRPHLPWLAAALSDPVRKWFVAALFAVHPVPKALFDPMLRACLSDVDASSVQAFVRPLSATFGSPRVVRSLERIVEAGSPREVDFARMALYWARHSVAKPRATLPK